MENEVTQDQIDQFCRAHDVNFYRWGEPGNWERRDRFRVSTFDFPPRGITVAVEIVKKWQSPQLFMTDGI